MLLLIRALLLLLVLMLLLRALMAASLVPRSLSNSTAKRPELPAGIVRERGSFDPPQDPRAPSLSSFSSERHTGTNRQTERDRQTEREREKGWEGEENGENGQDENRGGQGLSSTAEK